MSYEKATIHSILSKIKNGELVLPAIQRDFVWEPERMYKLLDSIFRGYPFSTLLFWNTKQRIQYREFTKDWSDSYRFTYQVKPEGKKGTMVLDGQQRLQTLYLAVEGSYENKILYFDILSGIDPDDVSQAKYHFQFITANEAETLNSREKASGEGDTIGLPKEISHHWIPLRDIATLNRQQTTSKAIQYLKLLHIDENSEAGQRISNNISTINATLRADEALNYFTVDKEYGEDGLETNLEEVLEIFVRVNSGGQVLSKSDLMFSLMQMLWEGAADAITDLIEALNRKGRYDFDKDFILKCALVCCGKGAKYDVNKLRDEATVKEIQQNFTKIHNALNNCMDFIVSKARFIDDRILRSYNTLIPFVYFFYIQPDQHIKNEETLFQMNHALYLSLMTSLFSHFADNYIDQIVNNTIKPYHAEFPGRFPTDGYLNFVMTKQGRNQVDDWLLQNNINYLMNILEGGTRLPEGRRSRRPEVDHIFPRSKLQELGISEEKINHYANFRLISQPENNWKRAQDPKTYFTSNPKAANRYRIPINLLDYSKYDEFLDVRRELIWSHLNQFFGFDGAEGEINSVENYQDSVSPPTPRASELRQVLEQMLTPEQKELPILNDRSLWVDVYRGIFNPTWSGRYHWALFKPGIHNVGDFAVAIMALKLKLAYQGYLPVYKFASELPDGKELVLPTREFGGYAWKHALIALEGKGFNWKQYLL